MQSWPAGIHSVDAEGNTLYHYALQALPRGGQAIIQVCVVVILFCFANIVSI